MDCRALLAMTIPGHGLPRFARNDDTGGMDCRATLAVTKALFKVRVRYLAGYGGLSMNRLVIANAVKQSMTPDCMDCRALACPEFIEGLAVTKALFKNKPYFVTA
jgi:hypothetical protein